MTYDTVVIGAGLAGLTAALRLVEEERQVLLVAKGVGSTHLAPATIDVLGVDGESPAEALSKLPPEHPYARLPVDVVAASMEWFKARVAGYRGGLHENFLLPTAVGAVKPSAVVPDSMAGGDLRGGGRFVFGVGWGWNREEFADHGRPPELRAQVVEEWVLVMRELWTHDVASFAGQFVTLAPSRMWPKPRQRPGPPILLGGPANERNFARIARWADGWITMGETIDGDRLRGELDALRRAWDQAGRDHAPRVTLIHNPFPDAPDLAEVMGVADELAIERVLYHVFDGNDTQMLRRLDRARTELAR